MKDAGEKGLSAHEAKRVVKRARAPRKISEPMQYTIMLKDGTESTGPFAAIKKLCPKVAPSTLHRRLLTGERKIAVLEKPAAGRNGSSKNRKKLFKL